jgi:hypothetical protein
MNLPMQEIIDSFERLPDSETRRVVCEILRRSVRFELSRWAVSPAEGSQHS